MKLFTIVTVVLPLLVVARPLGESELSKRGLFRRTPADPHPAGSHSLLLSILKDQVREWARLSREVKVWEWLDIKLPTDLSGSLARAEDEAKKTAIQLGLRPWATYQEFFTMLDLPRSEPSSQSYSQEGHDWQRDYQGDPTQQASSQAGPGSEEPHPPGYDQAGPGPEEPHPPGYDQSEHVNREWLDELPPYEDPPDNHVTGNDEHNDILDKYGRGWKEDKAELASASSFEDYKRVRWAIQKKRVRYNRIAMLYPQYGLLPAANKITYLRGDDQTASETLLPPGHVDPEAQPRVHTRRTPVDDDLDELAQHWWDLKQLLITRAQLKPGQARRYVLENLARTAQIYNRKASSYGYRNLPGFKDYMRQLRFGEQNLATKDLVPTQNVSGQDMTSQDQPGPSHGPAPYQRSGRRKGRKGARSET